MHPDPDIGPPTAARWPSLMLPGAAALGSLVAFVARDGFAAGDLFGALLIGLTTLVALTLFRRFAPH